MRDIKFKAWCETYGMSEIFFIFSSQISFDGGASYHGLLHLYDNLKIVQFTGLRDKDDTPIYEGDILRVPEYTPRGDGLYDDIIAEVYFEHERAAWFFRHGKHGSDYLSEGNDGEVIGNIHENPELLK